MNNIFLIFILGLFTTGAFFFLVKIRYHYVISSLYAHDQIALRKIFKFSRHEFFLDLPGFFMLGGFSAISIIGLLPEFNLVEDGLFPKGSIEEKLVIMGISLLFPYQIFFGQGRYDRYKFINLSLLLLGAYLPILVLSFENRDSLLVNYGILLYLYFLKCARAIFRSHSMKVMFLESIVSVFYHFQIGIITLTITKNLFFSIFSGLLSYMLLTYADSYAIKKYGRPSPDYASGEILKKVSFCLFTVSVFIFGVTKFG